MVKITRIESGKSRKRANVVFDSSNILTLHKNAVVEAGLGVGQELTEKQIQKLKNSDLLHRCIDAALNYLSYRPRSEAELKKRLYQHGFDEQTSETAVKRLKEHNLINDLEFAKYWRDNRISFNPKSRTMLKKELQQKGVDAETAHEIASEVDDESAAYNAARKKARIWAKLGYEKFRNKLINYLRWRGFGFEIINTVCMRLWEENQG